MSTRDHPDWWRPMGGQNSQDSTLERRSLIWNDNDVEAPDAPPASHTGIYYKGKFFPRGCRGKIEEIQIYSIRAAAGQIWLWVTPFPGLGPIHELTLTPGLAWGWHGVAVEEMWNYDSMYIFITGCSPSVSWGYDEEQPHDGHESVTWTPPISDVANRPFFRVVYTAETPGDVPVSGIVNVIEIPSVATRITEALSILCNNGAPSTVVAAMGAGTFLEVRVNFETSVTPTAGAPPAAVTYMVTVYVDGIATVHASNRDLTQSAVATAGRSSVGEFYQITVADPAYDITVLTLRMPLKFQMSLYVELYQSSGAAVDADVWVNANMIR